MLEHLIEISRVRAGFEAVLVHGNVTLSAIRPTERQARDTVIAMYEDAFFDCNRETARGARANGSMRPWSP
jgi:hypothetical protein